MAKVNLNVTSCNNFVEVHGAQWPQPLTLSQEFLLSFLKVKQKLSLQFGAQVQVDITELRSKWVQPRVERVTNNTFKLWQVRENLKLSKVGFHWETKKGKLLSEGALC